MSVRFVVAYGALVAIGALNREVTAFLLVAIFLALYPRRWPVAVAYAVLAFDVHQAVRVAVGDRNNVYTIEHVWWLNTYNPQLVNAALVYHALLAPIWAVAAFNFRRMPQTLRRLLMVVSAAYLPLWAALAVWQESRLMLPLMVLALPMVTMRTVIADHVEMRTGDMAHEDEKISSFQSSQVNGHSGAKVSAPAAAHVNPTLARVKRLRLRMRRQAS